MLGTRQRMTTDVQKETELFAVEKLLKFVGLENLKPLKSENPDFILPTNLGNVGIEVTDYHSSEKRREVEEAWKDFQIETVRYAQKHSDLQKLNVLLFFKKVSLPKKGLRQEFIEKTHIQIIKFEKLLGEKREEDFIVSDVDDLISEYLKSIHLSRLDLPLIIGWDWNQNVSSIGVLEEEISKIIEKKGDCEIKVKPCYLLINSGLQISQMTGIVYPARLNEYNRLKTKLLASPFEKVYISHFKGYCCWERSRNSWFEVKEKAVANL